MDPLERFAELAGQRFAAPEMAAEAATRTLKQVLGLTAALVVRPSDAALLVTAASVPSGWGLVAGHAWPRDEGPSLDGQRLLVCADVRQQWPLGARPWVAAFGARAVLGVSLGSAAGAPLGMLIGFDARSRPFEPRAVAVAQALAALLGLHLERLELLRRHAALEQSLAEQRAANERLERMSQTKSDFVSTVSHEFRTPLTTILGNSEMIQDDGVTIEEVREFAVEINKAGQRLKGMIEDMLDLDRMEAGMLNLRRERLDLNALVGEVVAQIRPIASRHAFRLQLDDAMPPLLADRDKLVQVVTNLVSNAIKYSPDGGEIRVVTAREARHARVSVIDQGMGIPPDALDRVFERFTRVETGQTRSIQGTGLGLPIVRQLVRLHGGRVWAASQLGRGSTFHVTLPFDDGVEAAR